MPSGSDRKANRFAVLVRHFLGRFFDTESLAPQADPAANLGPILGLLATPSAMLSILLSALTLRGWGLVTFRHFFVGFSMLTMALLVTYKWDALFPDRRDHHILTPLPLRPMVVFLARVTSLGLLLTACLVAANIGGTLLWPGVDTTAGGFRVMLAHAIATFGAGMFGAFTAATLPGLLMLFCSPALFRRVSVFGQTLFMAALICLLALTPVLGHRLEGVAYARSRAVLWYPAYAFTGLYEVLHPATTSDLLRSGGHMAVRMLLFSIATFTLIYVSSYLRSARRMLETSTMNPAGPGVLHRTYESIVNRVLLTSPVQRAVFHFISRTVARSTRHRVFLAAYGGFGVAIALMCVASGNRGVLQLPLLLSFVLVSGLRAAFNIPSELRANWLFRVTEGRSVGDCRSATRKWMFLCSILPLFLMLMPVELHYFPAGQALFHAGFGIVTALWLAEWMFTSFHKVPFACPQFPGRYNFVGICVLFVLGFTAWARVLAALKEALWHWPSAAVTLTALCGAAWVFHLARQSSESMVDFDGGEDLVHSLQLSAR